MCFTITIKNNLYSFFNRDEIAACLEKSYQRISFVEAQRMLYLDSEKDTKTFATKVGYSVKNLIHVSNKNLPNIDIFLIQTYSISNTDISLIQTPL